MNPSWDLCNRAAGAHKKELGGKAEVIYFDAFEHDFLDDPLVSLVSHLLSQTSTKTQPKEVMDKVKRAALPLVRGLLRTGVAVASAGLSEIAGPAIDALVEKVGKATEEQINDF
jgi:hypothetical protein